MEEKTTLKKVIIIISSLLGVIAIGLVMANYSDIDALIKHYILKEPVVFLRSGKVLRNEETFKDTGIPSDKLEDKLSDIGDSVLVKKTQKNGDIEMEYTLKDVKIYKNINKTSIDIKDCALYEDLEEELSNYSFMLIDMSVKNLSKEITEPYGDDPLPFILDVLVADDLSDVDKDSEMRANVGSYMIYFSEHPEFEDKNMEEEFYYHFDLPPGGSMDFQLGLILPQEAIDKKTTFLQLSSITYSLDGGKAAIDESDLENLVGFKVFK